MDAQDTAVSSSVSPLESSGELPARLLRGLRKYADPPPTKKRAAGGGASRSMTDEGSSSDSDVDFSVLPTWTKNTRDSTKWAVDTFVCWQKSRAARFPDNSEERPPSGLLKSSDPQLLGKWLGLFADEARKTDGKYYPAKTVYHILAGLYRYMRSLNPSCPNFLSDGPHFRSIHDAFVTERGNAVEYKIHRSLSEEEQDKLLASGTLSIDTPDALLKALFVLNAKSFGLHSAEHQGRLKLGYLKRMTDPLRYVYREQPAEAVSVSSMSRGKADKTVHALAGAQEGNLCHVHVLDFYLKKIPPEAFEKDVFYLHPVKDWASSEHWFTLRPMGRSAIAKLVGEIRATLPGLSSSSDVGRSPGAGVTSGSLGREDDQTIVPQSSQGSPPVSVAPLVYVVHGSDPNLSPASLEGGDNSQPVILSTATSAVAQNIITPQQQERMLEIARATPNPTNQPLFFIPATCTVPPGSTTLPTETHDFFQIPHTATITSPLNRSLYQQSAVTQPPCAAQPPVIDLTATDTATQSPPPAYVPAPAQTTNQQPAQPVQSSLPQSTPSQAPKKESQQLMLPSNSGLPQLVFNNCHVSIFVTQQAAPSSTSSEE